MLTIFSIPKPFAGAVGEAQMRAVASWRALDGRVVLVGHDPTIGPAAEAAGVDHVTEVACNEYGTPRLDSAFSAARDIAGDGPLCFVNADVVFVADLDPAIAASATLGAYLLVGQTRDLPLEGDELRHPYELRQRALRDGRLRGPTAIDWFVFPPSLFRDLPPFLVGRASFDNWLIWRARQQVPVVDATAAVVAIHQPHDYSHLSGGKDEAYYGPEAASNLRLAGGRRHIYTLHDASHRMGADLSIHRNLGSILRTRETARKLKWKLGLR